MKTQSRSALGEPGAVRSIEPDLGYAEARDLAGGVARDRVNAIVARCAERCGVSVEDILGRARGAQIVEARREAIELVHRVFPQFSSTHLGHIFGGPPPHHHPVAAWRAHRRAAPAHCRGARVSNERVPPGPLFGAANDNDAPEGADADAHVRDPRMGPVVSRAGDLWTVGPHRVLCGDATARADAARAQGALKPPLMVTDPPYGVSYDPAWRLKARNGGVLSVGEVANDNRADWRAAWRHFLGDVAYVWCAALKHSAVERSLAAAGFELRYQIVWNKGTAAFSRGHYHWKHESCLYAVRKGATARWNGARDQVTVWEAPLRVADDGRTGHATQKPVGLMQRPILNHTVRGEAVYDPFLGSGTTIVAAAACGRVGAGVEVEAAYVDAAVKRLARFTGSPALLDGDGRDFGAIAAERAA